MLHTPILIAALVCFAIAAFNIASPKVNLIALGLALFILSMFVTGCASGKYIGPSVGANVGYHGVSLGVALYGPNPSASNVVAVAVADQNATPSPTPAASRSSALQGGGK